MRNRCIQGLSTAGIAFVFSLTPAGSLLAQRHGSGGGVVRSGGPSIGRIHNGVHNGGVSRGGHVGARTPVVIPYYTGPLYWGDSAFWNGGGYPVQQAAPLEEGPGPVQAGPPERQDPPPVIINQYFSPDYMNPAVREYRPGDLPPALARPPEPEPSASRPAEPQREQFYMLAFKDGTVQSVRGYSVEGNTISFVTPYGSVRRVSIDQFDREMTDKLNRGR
jgi:hypothetical protein